MLFIQICNDSTLMMNIIDVQEPHVTKVFYRLPAHNGCQCAKVRSAVWRKDLPGNLKVLHIVNHDTELLGIVHEQFFKPLKKASQTTARKVQDPLLDLSWLFLLQVCQAEWLPIVRHECEQIAARGPAMQLKLAF